MLRQFRLMREDLIEASEHEEANIPIDKTPRMATKSERYERMMKFINFATVSLQKRSLTLAEGRDILDALLESVAEDKSNPASDLWRCKLGSKYIARYAAIMTDQDFENGVVKIQKNQLHLLSDAEKYQVKNLQIEGVGKQGAVSSVGISFQERLSKKRKTLSSAADYINCDFIHCSAAEVERLWSLCDEILVDDRKKMTPQLLECLFFCESIRDSGIRR